MRRPMWRLSCSPAVAAAILPLLAGTLWAAEPPAGSPARPGRLTMTTRERQADEDIELRPVLRPVQRGPKSEPAAGLGQMRGRAGAGAGAGNPLSPSTKTQAIVNAVGYLVRSQRNDGGWNSGEHGGNGAADLANTSIAGLAVLRAGQGDEQRGGEKSVERAVRFVNKRVAASTPAKLWSPTNVYTTVRNDLGVGIDAVLAALFLAEVVEDVGEDRPAAAGRKSLQTLMRIIADNVRDKPDAFAAGGSVLTRGLIAHAADRAARVGVEVDDDLVSSMVTANWQKTAGFYESAARIGCLHAAWRRSGGNGSRAFAKITDGAASGSAVSPGPGETAGELDRLAKSLTDQVLAPRGHLWLNPTGGEVFVSLMFLTGMLQETGAGVAADWSAAVDARLVQTQNAEGSWTGSSCINSRVFCTASALLVMVPARHDGAVAGR